jgi:hypothetical protein
MKVAHFGGKDVRLHANELRNPTTEQLECLVKVFPRATVCAPCGDDVEIGCAADWHDTVRNHHQFDYVHGFAEARLT